MCKDMEVERKNTREVGFQIIECLEYMQIDIEVLVYLQINKFKIIIYTCIIQTPFVKHSKLPSKPGLD